MWIQGLKKQDYGWFTQVVILTGRKICKFRKFFLLFLCLKCLKLLLKHLLKAVFIQ